MRRRLTEAGEAKSTFRHESRVFEKKLETILDFPEQEEPERASAKSGYSSAEYNSKSTF